MKYKFSLQDNLEFVADNVIAFKVVDNDAENISAKCRYVIIHLSKEAKIGLGTELIRLAHNYEEGKEVDILPASKEHGAKQSMGIFLTPDSCKLTIKCQSFKPIEELLEEYKKGKLQLEK